MQSVIRGMKSVSCVCDQLPVPEGKSVEDNLGKRKQGAFCSCGRKLWQEVKLAETQNRQAPLLNVSGTDREKLAG